MIHQIARAGVRLDLTFTDGTRRDFAFELDDPDGKQPITADISVEVDVVDVTDYAVDNFKRHEPGDRQTAAISIGGRGNRLSAADPNCYERMARAMAIFASYPVEHGGNISAEHDVIYAGPDPAVVSEAHLVELKSLGWNPEAQNNTFRLFT